MWFKRRDVHMTQNWKHGFTFASCVTWTSYCISLSLGSLIFKLEMRTVLICDAEGTAVGINRSEVTWRAANAQPTEAILFIYPESPLASQPSEQGEQNRLEDKNPPQAQKALFSPNPGCSLLSKWPA